MQDKIIVIIKPTIIRAKGMKKNIFDSLSINSSLQETLMIFANIRAIIIIVNTRLVIV